MTSISRFFKGAMSRLVHATRDALSLVPLRRAADTVDLTARRPFGSALKATATAGVVLVSSQLGAASEHSTGQLDVQQKQRLEQRAKAEEAAAKTLGDLKSPGSAGSRGAGVLRSLKTFLEEGKLEAASEAWWEAEAEGLSNRMLEEVAAAEAAAVGIGSLGPVLESVRPDQTGQRNTRSPVDAPARAPNGLPALQAKRQALAQATSNYRKKLTTAFPGIANYLPRGQLTADEIDHLASEGMSTEIDLLHRAEVTRTNAIVLGNFDKEIRRSHFAGKRPPPKAGASPAEEATATDLMIFATTP